MGSRYRDVKESMFWTRAGVKGMPVGAQGGLWRGSKYDALPSSGEMHFREN